MKKCVFLMALTLLLTGCGSQQTLETVTDEYLQPVMVPQRQMMISFPVDASVAVMQDDTAGTIYLCDGYTLTLGTTQSGDMEQTLRQATGFSGDQLRMIQTEHDGITRTESVWTAAGEGETQVGRIAVLDDGNYHYVLTCMADASKMQSIQATWEEVFGSFRLAEEGIDISTGS